ncbi:MAG: hypothetical protein KJ568_03980, partial [Actinobacteria bacterium]|nr:hypothetical protein [Actinomycetota bacterium]
NICEFKKVDLEYLFGLFNLYNRKNSGRWFWQKATFTGILKDDYNNFNAAVDETVKDLKQADEKKTKEQIKSASKIFDKLIVGLEMNCNVNREKDFNNVKGYLEKNFRELINDNLRRIK